MRVLLTVRCPAPGTAEATRSDIGLSSPAPSIDQFVLVRNNPLTSVLGRCVTISGHQVTCCFDRGARSRVDSEDEMELALQIGLIVTSLLLILLVLLHRGRGGGLSSLFGGGMQSSLSGSSVAEKNLDRATLLIGAIWLICVIGLGLLIKVA